MRDHTNKHWIVEGRPSLLTPCVYRDGEVLYYKQPTGEELPFHTQHTWSLFSQPRFLVNFRNQHSVWYFFLRILYYFTHANRHIPACFSPSCSRLDCCGFHVILASLFWAYFSFSVSWLCKKNERLTFGCFGNKICGWLIMQSKETNLHFFSFLDFISL